MPKSCEGKSYTKTLHAFFLADAAWHLIREESSQDPKANMTDDAIEANANPKISEDDFSDDEDEDKDGDSTSNTYTENEKAGHKNDGNSDTTDFKDK